VLDIGFCLPGNGRRRDDTGMFGSSSDDLSLAGFIEKEGSTLVRDLQAGVNDDR
jgi:hypothetical protein